MNLIGAALVGTGLFGREDRVQRAHYLTPKNQPWAFQRDIAQFIHL